MSTTLPTTTELSMPTALPYFWRMYQLERFHWSRGFHFFDGDTKRFFSSRIQSTPPYKGRVFVTSERNTFSNDPRYYTVRCIRLDGSIETIGEFQGFSTRYNAHAYAKAYAEENFARVGNESVRLPVENKTA